MEKHVYQDMIQQQNTHWWYKARREIINAVLKRHTPSSKKRSILEIGCGMGGNISLLQNYGDVFASDSVYDAIAYTRKMYEIPVEEGSLPHNIPFGQSFDMICMFDVLEHVEQHEESLQELEKRLNSGGYLIITVPAYNWLFGPHDVLNHHFRRYTRRELAGLIKKNTTLQIVHKTYFNTLLFPIVLLTRLLDKIRGNKVSSGYESSEGPLNALLYRIFRIERNWVNRIPFAFGTSVLIVCKK